MISLIISYFLLGLFDYLYIHKLKSRYFCLHALINFYIVYLCYKDTYAILFDTVNSLKIREVNNDALYVMLSIHLYHITPCLNFKLHKIDYVHHFISAFFGGGLVFFSDFGILQNYCIFFMCGLPGLLDYILLICVKENLIDSITEKYYNCLINLILRSPFLLYCVLLAHIQNSLLPDLS